MTENFNALKVTSFESRLSKEMEKLITYHSGIPRVCRSMKEVPVRSKDISGFARDLYGGKVSFLVLFTGVGTRMLSSLMAEEGSPEKYAEALKNVTVITRGPKPAAALKDIGTKPDITIPPPNTWKDLISTIDLKLKIKNKTVYVQEYGAKNREFLKNLKDRGAQVKTITVYKWGLPDDLQPLKAAVRSICSEEEDVVLFTSSHQVVNLFKVASDLGSKSDLYEGLSSAVIGSIGPTTTETLKNHGISADYEPDNPKMGNLVREVARASNRLVTKKRKARSLGIKTAGWKRTDMVWEKAPSPHQDGKKRDSVFLKACNLEKTDYTPIWIMRQAGRFLREYKQIRSKVSFIEMCKTPDLAAEVTLMAAEKLNVDAAIIFSDILLILESLGLDLEYQANDGPKIGNKLGSKDSVDSLPEFDPDSLAFVYDAIRLTRKALDPRKAVIGFAGAPFTLASYAIEGSGSRNYARTKTLMFQDGSLWDLLMTRLTSATADYLNRQIEAGADAVQIFDSWVGCLSPKDYGEFVFPHTKRLVEMIDKNVPVILFGTGTSSLLKQFAQTGCGVIGVDWRVEIKEAWEQVGRGRAVQGNLDPVVMLSNKSHVNNEAKRILNEVGGRPGHIFNLGHGILPSTPVDNVLSLVDTVHEHSYKMRQGTE